MKRPQEPGPVVNACDRRKRMRHELMIQREDTSPLCFFLSPSLHSFALIYLSFSLCSLSLLLFAFSLYVLLFSLYVLSFSFCAVFHSVCRDLQTQRHRETDTDTQRHRHNSIEARALTQRQPSEGCGRRRLHSQQPVKRVECLKACDAARLLVQLEREKERRIELTCHLLVL